MATNLDLQEQEQIDELKHFWKRWGDLITWLLIVALGAYAAWNGWQYWQRKQAATAAGLYEQMLAGVQAGDTARMERALADLQASYGKTAYGAYGGLLAAKTLHEQGKSTEARAALQWVADQSTDPGLKASARLRMAALLVQDKAYDEALKVLSVSFPAQFVALAADRRGDVLLAQGKRDEAAVEYGKAYQGLSGDSASAGYLQLIGVKLNALGVNPDTSAAKAAS